MASRRRHIGASRRKRRDDEGEDEGSMVGDLEEDSLSEASADSHQDDEDADGEGSEGSDNEGANGSQVNSRARDQSTQQSSTSPEKRGLKAAVSDTEAMMNGLKLSDETKVGEIHFDQVQQDREPQTGRAPSAPPTEPRREASTARKRRENDKYVKERDQNPAFVPTRGSFFLHDKRTTEGTNGFRPLNKTKSRPYGLIVDGNARRYGNLCPSHYQPLLTCSLGAPPSPMLAKDNGPMIYMIPWPETTSVRPNNHPRPCCRISPRPSLPLRDPRPPNRSFSSTTLVGNVPVVVFLPGMTQPTPFSAVPKKQHTRLPQHRPPLRRDKPVRISLPGQPPRYIFPSTERSFIFIPRALRPNQQGYRGRGRGGFYGGRRPSYYTNTVYTPSVLSRRSSLGMAASQDGYPSPAGSVYSRPMVPPDTSKPIVRLPPPRPPIGVPPTGPGAMGPGPPMQLPHPAYRESRPAPIPMHQPRPQKAVSVADIESPARFPFNPPHPHQDQPFHHQVPIPVNGPGHDPTAHGPPSQASVTPLSQIPERAIHAQPFQPYNYQQPGFYPPAYPGAMYYPASGPDYSAYNGPVGPGTSVASFPQGQQPMPYASSGEQPSQPGTVAHESGGTVYFYDANQMYSNPSVGAGAGPGVLWGWGG
ncbi:hypothetical protein NUU61_000390 [Penicillium alfredii]|uniref:Btz domain-containing protein n=1 Tax=Penicillium alfredii TaxID=1506179 RepID=A0A9W9KQZ2_9EURO|nr:uncharacterized protein NUU61_000390 [Penicillium alfredii]KAJ5114631.1 hypothetical protein NUU61_000390 [Penicillium alfredii]